MVEVQVKTREEPAPSMEGARPVPATPPPLAPEPVRMKPRVRRASAPVRRDRQAPPHPHEEEAERRLAQHRDDPRFVREREEMKEVHDLDEIDDDVEVEATLLEWQAEEHTHRPKSPLWFSLLALATTVVVAIQLYFFNFFGALTITAVAVLVYYIAQQRPQVARYRIMVDGIAINNALYHWQDLTSFNVCYEPDNECKTVIFRGESLFSPHIHLEIGDADPVEIREILLEFLDEDQDMEEPLVDVLARRLGF